ncbi:MAG TPA: PhoH family protein [Bacteroidetes bacterium]|nr:PhoH family protein [Bacteroidota bacterium]
MAKKKKIFVLDTNVILHDHNCLSQFRENDVAIPITVLEELDNFKKGHDQINYNAREFIRTLDSLSGDKLVDGGVSPGKGKGKIEVITSHLEEAAVRQTFLEKKPDHRILSVALYLTQSNGDRDVILISKDVNLRLKAKSLGVKAEDYTTDRISDIAKLYSGRAIVEDMPDHFIDRFYTTPYEIPAQELPVKEYLPNQFFILKNRQKSVLAFYNAETDTFQKVQKEPAYGITPRNSEQTFALHALRNKNAQLVTLAGKAGTGKTLLALAAALEERKDYQQIFLARPIIPLSNRDMGFLPGSLEAKMDPFMQPLYDNLGVIKNQFSEKDKNYQRLDDMLKSEKLHIAPLAYIRGRSLERIFFIVDEAQNLTPHEIKTIITRAGDGTKIVFTGDPYQIDTPYLDAQSNGLTYLIDRMKGQSVYAHVTLERGERSYLAELASDLL